MKETWLMVCAGIVLDECAASSKEEASQIFQDRSRYEDWSESDIVSEADYVWEKNNHMKTVILLKGAVVR